MTLDRGNPDTFGPIGETGSHSGGESIMIKTREQERRKPGSQGRPIRLADGCEWLLPDLQYTPGHTCLTQPDLDRFLDRFHEQTALGEEIAVADLLGSARLLLLTNYELSDDEVCELLSVQPGEELEELAHAVFAALFGAAQRVRSFSDWVRASLLANGLSDVSLTPDEVQDVLAILVANKRTLPETQFVDVCRAALDREALERLI